MTFNRYALQRVVRRWLPTALREFSAPLFNTGQALAAIIAVAALRLNLIQAGPIEIIRLADDWSLWLIAFAQACVAWAALSLLRTPWVIIREDAKRGRWIGSRFHYHEPLLIGTVVAEPTGEVEGYPLTFPEAEPGALVYYRIHIDGAPPHLVASDVGGRYLMMPLNHMRHKEQGGATTLADGNRIFLRLQIDPAARPATARLYALSYDVHAAGDEVGERGTWEPGPERRWW